MSNNYLDNTATQVYQMIDKNKSKISHLQNSSYLTIDNIAYLYKNSLAPKIK